MSATNAMGRKALRASKNPLILWDSSRILMFHGRFSQALRHPQNEIPPPGEDIARSRQTSPPEVADPSPKPATAWGLFCEFLHGTHGKNRRIGIHRSILSPVTDHTDQPKPTKICDIKIFFGYNFKFEKMWNFGKTDKFVKFEILNPRSTQNLKSLTLVTKMPISLKQLLKSPIFCIKILKTNAGSTSFSVLWGSLSTMAPRATAGSTILFFSKQN